MSRRARIALAGVPMHVRQRGNNRAACFVADDDRAFYLFHLARNASRFGCDLHAYCLMTNHVHLLLTPAGTESCASLMKNLGQLYTQYFNKRYNRTGSLWEGRFRSCLVQTEDYLLRCYRYIELNPVRAGLATEPGGYRWSSYAENETGSPSGCVRPHPEYLRMGSDAAERAMAYASLVRTALDPTQLGEIRAATNGGHALGDPSFRKEIAQALGRPVEAGLPGRPSRARTDDRQPELALTTK